MENFPARKIQVLRRNREMGNPADLYGIGHMKIPETGYRDVENSDFTPGNGGWKSGFPQDIVERVESLHLLPGESSVEKPVEKRELRSSRNWRSGSENLRNISGNVGITFPLRGKNAKILFV